MHARSIRICNLHWRCSVDICLLCMVEGFRWTVINDDRATCYTALAGHTILLASSNTWNGINYLRYPIKRFHSAARGRRSSVRRIHHTVSRLSRSTWQTNPRMSFTGFVSVVNPCPSLVTTQRNCWTTSRRVWRSRVKPFRWHTSYWPVTSSSCQKGHGGLTQIIYQPTRGASILDRV